MDNAKKHVLMIGPDRNANGGISSVVNQYYAGGLDQMVNLKYLATTGNGNAIKKLILFYKSVLKFGQIINHVDIVHIHMSKKGSFYRKAFFVKSAKKRKKKVIIHIHSSQFLDFYYGASVHDKKRIKETLAMADKVIVLSEYWKTQFSQICDRQKICILENGITKADFIRTDYTDKNIIFLGKICEEKGLVQLFEAVQNLQAKVPDLRVFVAGAGEDERFHQLCQSLNIEEKIKFLGWITGKEKEEYLKKCSVFVLPSHSEGLPVSLLEAMSYGCACVATKVGGIPEVLEDGKNGLLIEPKDTESLSKALEQCLLDLTLKEKLAKDAVETIVHTYDIHKICNTLLEIYQDNI